MRILIIDDDKSLCRSLQIHLEWMNHIVSYAHRAEDGIQSIRDSNAEIVFLDLELPDRRGVELLKEIPGLNEATLVVMITGVQDAKATVEAIRDGAFDYIRKPLDLDAIAVTIAKADQFFQRRRELIVEQIGTRPSNPLELVGRDPKIIDVLKKIGITSQNRTPVLIEGESGTGKELVARALHNSSTPDSPFIAVNCSAIVATLLESELFGHEKGSFTGAVSQKKGKFELAADGTIFLDEVGEMPIELQAKLLRALQERRFERVGGTKSLGMNARVVAATNQDLKSLISKTRFREDLYYRLAVSIIRVPPLKERLEDVHSIAKHLIELFNPNLKSPINAVESAALLELQNQDWPGNVRQLNNVLIRAAMAVKGSTLTLHHVRDALAEESSMEHAGTTTDFSLRQAEKSHIAAVLRRTDWNISRSAQLLGVTRGTLRNKISAFGIAREMPIGSAGAETSDCAE